MLAGVEELGCAARVIESELAAALFSSTRSSSSTAAKEAVPCGSESNRTALILGAANWKKRAGMAFELTGSNGSLTDSNSFPAASKACADQAGWRASVLPGVSPTRAKPKPPTGAANVKVKVTGAGWLNPTWVNRLG